MELKDDGYILHNVVSNKDGFSWKELNCMYKPYAIALSSFSENYYDFFLYFFSQYLIYVMGTDEFIYNKEHILFSYFEKELQNILCVKLDLIFCNSDIELYDKIEKLINDNNIVICPIDLYALPFSTVYGENHQRHFTIIKGYDRRKRIFYILDTVHMELGAGTVYTDFMIEYDRMYQVTKSFTDNFDDCKFLYFWSMKKFKSDNNCLDNCLKYFIKCNKNILSDKIYKCLELDILEEIKIGKFQRELESDLRLINMRSVYYNSLVAISSKFDAVIFKKIRFRCMQMIKKWTTIKYRLIYKYERKECNIEKLEHYIKKVIIDDKNLLRSITELTIENNFYMPTENNICIINNKNADIVYEKNCILVKLSDKQIYDTWKAKDDACQILFSVNKKSKIDFEVSIENVVYYDKSCMSGIVIVFDNGYKILFGIMQGNRIEIDAPFDASQNNLYRLEYIMPKTSRLKVTMNQRKISFYICDVDENKIFEIDAQSQIAQIGILAKTWEKYKCCLIYKNIYLNGREIILN